jgi:hypothetical protein
MPTIKKITEQMFFLRPATCHLRSAFLPFSRLHQFLDLALDEVALQSADV